MTAWDERIVGAQQIGVGGPLAEALPAFVRWQVGHWPRLAEARAALANVAVRTVRVGDRETRIQFNPARAVSTTAKVDAASIQARPCFLCPGNLPPEEHGLSFGARWVVLPNPAPILMDHLVIAHREHTPQVVKGSLDGLLDFAVDSGGAVTALYNGPKSGASAPDHLHLQAVQAGVLPEEQLVIAARERGEVPGERLGQGEGFVAWRARGAVREILGVAGTRKGVKTALREAIATLGGDEPGLNLLARAHGDEVFALLFPRGKHRPDMFFAEGPEQRIVSPGVIDMAGIIVTVRASDYEALDGPTIEQIYREVTLPDADRWFGQLAQRWSRG